MNGELPPEPARRPERVRGHAAARSLLVVAAALSVVAALLSPAPAAQASDAAPASLRPALSITPAPSTTAASDSLSPAPAAHAAAARGPAASAVLAAAPGVVALAQPGGFGDVAGDAYYSEPVAALAALGVFAGTECDAGFCPDGPIDRKTMAVWVVRVLDGSDPTLGTGSRFDDVSRLPVWWVRFIERMAELGVTRGCGDGTNFCPNDFVTRAQMAVFLSRAYNLPAGPDPGFSDVSSDAWFAADVARLAASGVTKGCGDGTAFCPGQDTTRAQMATFLWRVAWPSSSGGGIPGEVTGLAYDPATRTATWDPTLGAASYQINELILTDETREGLVYFDIACCSYTITDPDITHLSIPAANSIGEGPWTIEAPTALRPSSAQRIAYTRDVVGIWVANADGTDPQQLTSGVNDSHPSWSPDGTEIAFATWNEIWVMDADGTNRESLFYGGRKATAAPIWSPVDSTKIAFRKYGTSGWEIWTTDVDGTNTRMLTESYGDPAWSPDGAKIAYDYFRGIWVMDADGTDQQRLTDGGDRPVWSPDGTMIAYDDSSGIWVMDADGTDQQRLTDGGERPVWSPDGTMIAYSDRDVAGSSDNRAWVMDANGSNRRQLADNGVGVVWSPDGTRIFYRDDNTDIRWAINPDGTNRLQITAGGLASADWIYLGSGRSWLPDGTRIVYEANNTELWVGTPNGTTQTRLAEDVDGRDSYAWSPDGTRIAYYNNGGISVIDAAGNNRQRITDKTRYGAQPDWSPNGRKIAYSNGYRGDDNDLSGIWIVEANGTEQTRLATDGVNPAWSPNGLRIAYNTWNDSWVIDADGTNRTKLADDGENPAWSPDGSRLAYDKYSSRELWVVNADGSNQQIVSDEVEYIYGYAWSPDSTKIAYVVADGIWVVEANGAQRTKLADDGENPVWSPDGTRIAYNTGTSDRAIWTMDADGANQQRITEDGHSPAWSSDGKRIAYETYDGTNSGAWVINADGTNQKRLTPDQGTGPVWSP